MSYINVVQYLWNFAQSKYPKFEVFNSKNKKSGQQSGFQKVWKILLLSPSFQGSDELTKLKIDDRNRIVEVVDGQ